MPEGSCNRFLYFVLLLLSEQAHFYLVRLILLFTFTASATAAQQIAKINPKIIIILFLSFFNCYPTCVFLCFPFVCSSAQQCFQHLLLLEADLVVYLYSLCKSCTTNRKNKTKNNHNVTLSFFNSYFVIPNYASLSCLSAIVSHAFSAASSFISDAKVVLFVFAHKRYSIYFSSCRIFLMLVK